MAAERQVREQAPGRLFNQKCKTEVVDEGEVEKDEGEKKMKKKIPRKKVKY